MKQQFLFARVGLAASAALLALVAVVAPASAASCTSNGNWRDDGGRVTIRANVADASDGWKVTQRKYATRNGFDNSLKNENVHSEATVLTQGDTKLWGGRKLDQNGYDNDKTYNPAVNLFETTFLAANGTSVVCTVELRGKDINGNLAYKFFGAHCNGPDKDIEYVSCRRQYGASVQRFRVWLTLNDLK